MKVLYIINSLDTGGAEKLIVDSVPLFKRQGVQACVLLLSNNETPFRNRLQQDSNIEVKALTSGSLYNPFLIFKIIPYLRKYDIIHLHLFPTLYWVVFAHLISFSNAKLVYTEHNTNNRRRESRLFKFIDRLIYAKLDRIVCITNDVKHNLIRHLNFDERAVQVINNGIDIKIFDPNNLGHKQFNLFDSDDFILIQVSSFSKQKDQETLIRSLTLLPERIKLLLVGSGKYIERSKELVVSFGLEHRVLFLGNRYDIPELLNYCDVVVLSSHWEGFGLAILEGMASRKPSIASNIEGIKEIVGGYGLLFNPGDFTELAALIQKLASDQVYYNEIAESCYLRSKHYSIDKMIVQYVETYKSVVNNKT